SLPRPGLNGLNMGGELVAVLGEQRCSTWQHEIEAARQPVAAVDEPDANRRIGFVGRIGVLVIAATGVVAVTGCFGAWGIVAAFAGVAGIGAAIACRIVVRLGW